MYLLTFWPPGPDDRLKFTSQIFSGIVLTSKFASHVLASLFSASDGLSIDVDNADRYVGENSIDSAELVETLVVRERTLRNMLRY